MRQIFQPEWRTQNRLKRRFYAKYMGWIEKGGYFVVFCVLAAFIFAFNYKVDDVIKADNVPIEATKTTLSSTKDSLVVETFVYDFAEVKEGQPLFAVAEGEQDITRFLRKQALDELRSSGMALTFGKLPDLPKTRTILSPVSGVFRMRAKEKTILAGEPLADVIDYQSLMVKADLEGNTVPKAKQGLAARLSGINVGSAAGLVFRASTDHGDILSGRLLDAEIKSTIEQRLKGSTVLLRDDVPLSVEGVKEVQVDSRLHLTPAGSHDAAIQTDPPLDFALTGTVIEGVHAATVQIANLPPDVLADVQRAIEDSAKKHALRTVQGQDFRVTSLRDTNLVVQLTTSGTSGSRANALSASAINRKFMATIQLSAPPKFLIDEVKQADREGRTITCRVEVATGSRPIAFILLKKS